VAYALNFYTFGWAFCRRSQKEKGNLEGLVVDGSMINSIFKRQDGGVDWIYLSVGSD